MYFLKYSLSIDRFSIEKGFRCSNVQYNDIDTDNIQNLVQRWHALEFHFNEKISKYYQIPRGTIFNIYIIITVYHHRAESFLY